MFSPRWGAQARGKSLANPPGGAGGVGLPPLQIRFSAGGKLRQGPRHPPRPSQARKQPRLLPAAPAGRAPLPAPKSGAAVTHASASPSAAPSERASERTSERDPNSSLPPLPRPGESRRRRGLGVHGPQNPSPGSVGWEWGATSSGIPTSVPPGTSVSVFLGLGLPPPLPPLLMKKK